MYFNKIGNTTQFAIASLFFVKHAFWSNKRLHICELDYPVLYTFNPKFNKSFLKWLCVT